MVAGRWSEEGSTRPGRARSCTHGGVSWALLCSVAVEGLLSDPWFLDLLVGDRSFVPTWGDDQSQHRGVGGSGMSLKCPFGTRTRVRVPLEGALRGPLGKGQECGPSNSRLCPRANQCPEPGFPQKLGAPCLGPMLGPRPHPHPVPPPRGLHCRACLSWNSGFTLPMWTGRLADTCWGPWAQRVPPAAPPACQDPGPALPRPPSGLGGSPMRLAVHTGEWGCEGRPSWGWAVTSHSCQAVWGCRAITAGNGSA